MTNREKMIEGMKLLKEGCKNIYSCNAIECPLYYFCCFDNGDSKISPPPCNWVIIKEDK